MELLIGIGAGLAAVVTVVLALVFPLRAAQAQADTAFKRADVYAQKLDVAYADQALLATANVTLTTNLNELKRELATRETRISELGARVESIEKARNDLLRVLQDNPGAVSAAVGTAFDRLREAVSQARGAQAPAAGGDPGRGEARAVHEAPDGDAPR